MKKLSRVYSFLLMVLCFSSLIYLTNVEANEPVETPLASIQGLPPSIKDGITLNPDVLAETTNTSGTYKNVAYFTQDNYVDLDANGYVFEWEKYEDVKDDSANFDNVVFFLDNASSNPDLRWHPLDTYDQAQSMSIVQGDYINSTVFSPEFNVDTYIKGKVYFMSAGETWRSAYSEWTLKVTLERFNPSTGQADYITEASGEFDDTNEYTGSYLNSSNSAYQGMIYEGNIQTNTLIPAGYRLRATYEAMLSSASYGNESERFELRTGNSGGSTFYQTQWDIDVSNDTFDNFYHIENGYESLGVQFYMYQEDYPSIDLTGLENNTIYTTPTNGTTTISADSILNQYKWDSDSFTTFSSPEIVSLPETNGWHTLTVQASDFFNNMAEATYTLGYDAISSEVVLNSPANNSLIAGGEILDFSIYESTSVTYEWDKNATEFPLSSPFDITTPLSFLGSHQLTIHFTDPFDTTLFEYFFIFDNAPPDVLLINVLNETTQPQGKNIDVVIDDVSVPIVVQYKWDADSFATWSPFLGNLYRAYLPSTAGWHNLSVFANDSYGNSITKVFSFNTSLTLLNVDLYNLLNNSYYQGGNTVEVAITNDNGTVKYFWGNNPWSDGTVIAGIMTLSGGDALSSTPGTYILTVIVGNTDNEQIEFKFLFRVDQEDPTIVQTNPIPDYNDTRFLDSEIFYFTIDDNWTDTSDLTILYSIDNADNKTLSAPFYVYLSGLTDGSHNLTIFAFDIAGNYYRYYITFIIDTTIPYIPFNIIGDVVYDSYRYAPPGSQVNALATDTDPGLKSYYRWSSVGAYIEYTDFFFLPLFEDYDRLYLLANDTLGNTRYRSYWITLDDTSPTITLNFLANNTNINVQAPIEFEIDDFRDEAVKYREYQWLIDDEPTIIYENDFDVLLTPQHITNDSITEAIISLSARDALNHEYNVTYRFILDFIGPSVNLISTTNESYIDGGEILEFSVPSSDIASFSYKWDLDEGFREITGDPWYVPAPYEDGNRTLTLRLLDNTSMGIFPNSAEYTFVFIIDDIEVNYVTPNGFDTDYEVSMKYGEIFNFSINVVDRVNQTAIDDLIVNIVKEHPLINLSISYFSYNATFYNGTNYNFTIFATNITNNAYSYIDIELYQFAFNKQIIRVYVKVNRQEGNLLILDAPESIVFEDEIEISFQLRDDSNTTGQDLAYFEVDGYTTGFSYELIDAINYIYSVTFSSNAFFTSKGSKTFTFYTQSNFYYGVKNDTSTLSITILPIPITLAIDVANVEIIYGSDLVVTAVLLREDSTPIQFLNVTFMFEIHYQNGTILELNITTSTNLVGVATINLLITEDMDYVLVLAVFDGSPIYDPISDVFGENIYAISAGLSLQIILIIVGAAVLFSIIIGFVIYRVVRARPFEELMEKVSEEDIEKNMEKISPGVVLSIFDQKKGPTPLIGNHSLETSYYKPRMRIGYENFLLKISDQAYSSLGFEEHDERRRIGSINLPNEDMIGFIHGVQLPNPAMRGGFENLTLIVLADKEAGSLLLANQEFMLIDIDELIVSLKGRAPLSVVEEHLQKIRRRSVIIMLAAQKNVKKDKKEIKKYQ